MLSLRLPLFCAALACSLSLSSCGKSHSESKDKPPAGARIIGVMPAGTADPFWKAVETGARRAGADLGVEIKWKSPPKENDHAQQSAIIAQFTAERLAGIVVAPLDPPALRRPIQDAVLKGVPVVVIASVPSGDGDRLAGEAVKILVAHLDGHDIPASTDGGPTLITPGNFTSAEVESLLGTK